MFTAEDLRVRTLGPCDRASPLPGGFVPDSARIRFDLEVGAEGEGLAFEREATVPRPLVDLHDVAGAAPHHGQRVLGDGALQTAGVGGEAADISPEIELPPLVGLEPEREDELRRAFCALVPAERRPDAIMGSHK